MIKLSVIFPVGRVTPFTMDSLSSCLEQSFKDFVLIVVDNTLNNEFQKLLCPHLEDRIKYVRYNDKFGAAEARNHGLKHANTEFLAFLDSDDYLKRDHLKTALKILLNTNADVYSCGYKNRYRGGLEIDRIPPKNIRIFDLLTFSPIGHSTVVLRARVNPRYPATKTRHDLRLWLRLHSEKAKFVTNDEIMVVRNIVRGSLSDKKLRLIREHYDIHRNVMNFSIFKSLLVLFILCTRHFGQMLSFWFLKLDLLVRRFFKVFI